MAIERVEVHTKFTESQLKTFIEMLFTDHEAIGIVLSLGASICGLIEYKRKGGTDANLLEQLEACTGALTKVFGGIDKECRKSLLVPLKKFGIILEDTTSNLAMAEMIVKTAIQKGSNE